MRKQWVCAALDHLHYSCQKCSAEMHTWPGPLDWWISITEGNTQTHALAHSCEHICISICWQASHFHCGLLSSFLILMSIYAMCFRFASAAHIVESWSASRNARGCQVFSASSHLCLSCSSSTLNTCLIIRERIKCPFMNHQSCRHKPYIVHS